MAVYKATYDDVHSADGAAFCYHPAALKHALEAPLLKLKKPNGFLRKGARWRRYWVVADGDALRYFRNEKPNDDELRKPAARAVSQPSSRLSFRERSGAAAPAHAVEITFRAVSLKRGADMCTCCRRIPAQAAARAGQPLPEARAAGRPGRRGGAGADRRRAGLPAGFRKGVVRDALRAFCRVRVFHGVFRGDASSAAAVMPPRAPRGSSAGVVRGNLAAAAESRAGLIRPSDASALAHGRRGRSGSEPRRDPAEYPRRGRGGVESRAHTSQ